MKGAIFFSGKYGSTEQYANWIGEATGLPVFNIDDPVADPAKYDFLILGSSIIFFRLTIRKWVRDHLGMLKDRSKMLFSVSGAGPSYKLEKWITKSLPPVFLSKIEHVALRGRLDHSKISWWLRLILKVGALFNRDSEASKDESFGFDYMEKDSIRPIVEFVRRLQKEKIPAE